MIQYISPIDPHVHLRGKEYSKHKFLEFGFKDAQQVGLAAVLEQPNPEPWLTDLRRIKRRLQRAEQYKGDIEHRIHIGITNDLLQVGSALRAIRAGKYKLVSDKTFYVHSYGNMGILAPDIQREIWELKAQLGYQGVSIGHFEAEDQFSGRFDASDPISHALKQNPHSELVQVERQIRNAKDVKFQGTFYIAHV